MTGDLDYCKTQFVKSELLLIADLSPATRNSRIDSYACPPVPCTHATLIQTRSAGSWN
jgi:hypothetical protein